LDLIPTYWPQYFQERTEDEEAPKRWINVCTESDVLGSKFLDTSTKSGEVAVCGVEFDGGKVRRPEDADNLRLGPKVHAFLE